MIKNITILLAILLFTSSCTSYWYKPMGARVFKYKPKEGTPGFKLGWEHGCESGLATQFGNSFYMDFYQWKKDPQISMANPSPNDVDMIRRRYGKELNINWNNPEEVRKNFSDYKNVFWVSHAFCRHTALGSQQAAGANPGLPGEGYLYDPGKWSVGNVWKMDAKGDTRWKTNW